MGEQRKHVVKVAFVARWEDYVEVDVPDGVTENEAEEALNAALNEMDMTANLDDTDIEAESVEWETEPVYAPPDPSVPDAAWVDVDGVRWATNGHVAIRDGCPLPDPAARLPTMSYADWLIPAASEVAFGPPSAERIAASIRRWIWEDQNAPHDGYFSPVYAPLLKAGTATRIRGEVAALVRDANRAPIAIVKPIRDGEPGDGSVRANGEPS